MRVVIFGGTGLLGQSFYDYFINKKFLCYRSSLKKKSDFVTDLSSLKRIVNFINKTRPNLIINCAGETDVSLCNKDLKLAYKANVIPVKNIIKAISICKKDCLFVQISTDQVYNSNKINSEEKINLTNGYGTTKFMAELEALKHKKTLVIRTNFFGKSKSKNRSSYTDYIISNLSNKKKIKVPSNIIFNPIHIEKLIDIIFKLIKRKKNGVFNIGSIDPISKYNFAVKIAKKYNLDIKYLSAFKSIYSKNQRPLGTYMSVKKLKNLKINVPSIQKGIDSI